MPTASSSATVEKSTQANRTRQHEDRQPHSENAGLLSPCPFGGATRIDRSARLPMTTASDMASDAEYANANAGDSATDTAVALLDHLDALLDDATLGRYIALDVAGALCNTADGHPIAARLRQLSARAATLHAGHPTVLSFCITRGHATFQRLGEVIWNRPGTGTGTPGFLIDLCADDCIDASA